MQIPWYREVEVTEDVRVYGHKLTAGMKGTVKEGSYSGGVFDYSKEWPVQFGVGAPELPETLGVPPEFLRLVED